MEKVNRVKSKGRVLLREKGNRILADVIKARLKKEKINSQPKYTLKLFILCTFCPSSLITVFEHPSTIYF
jgi:hypothetical protein